LINDNSDCHIIVGGDFNVDFSRNRIHTAMLSSFCANLSLTPAAHHVRNTVDYTYNFNMSRFGILDHFVLSGIIFDKSVINHHEPIGLQLHPEINILGVSERVHTPHVSWPKASEFDLCKYRSVLDPKLRDIILPTEALLCNNLTCNKAEHLRTIHVFAGSYLKLASQRRTYPFHLHAIGQLQVVCLVGRSVSSR